MHYIALCNVKCLAIQICKKAKNIHMNSTFFKLPE